MKYLTIKIILLLPLFFGVAVDTQAAVTDLFFDNGKTTDLGSHPTSWRRKYSQDSISNEYKLHQQSYSFNSG